MQMQSVFTYPAVPIHSQESSSGFTEQVSSIISIRVCLSIHPATSAWNTDCFDEIA